MIDKNTVVRVTNRDTSYVGYYIPELNIKRTFTAGEVKELEAGEIRALAWTDGGRAVIKNHLIVDNKELIKELFTSVEPEYYYTADDIVELLLHGSEDQLHDAIDFGYDGTTALIKDKAVELKLNDIRKRDIILQKTGFDVTGAIRINEESEKLPEETKSRRAAPINSDGETQESPTERRAAPKFKVAN